MSDSLILKVGDEMIAKFCEHFEGDREYSMPMIQHAFNRAGADLTAPTKRDLELVSQYLIETLSNFDPDGAHRLKMEYNRLIRSL
jgi:hypothetical protein